MNIDPTALPDDVELLHQMVRSPATERSALAEAQAEIEQLRLIIRKLQRSQFGRRVERQRDDQPQFGFEDLEADLARAEAKLPPQAEKPAKSRPPALPSRTAKQTAPPRSRASRTERRATERRGARGLGATEKRL